MESTALEKGAKYPEMTDRLVKSRGSSRLAEDCMLFPAKSKLFSLLTVCKSYKQLRVQNQNILQSHWRITQSINQIHGY